MTGTAADQSPDGDVNPDDFRDLCSFCAEVERAREHNLLLELMPDLRPDDFILRETSDFVVIPGVGSVCDGYVIISPKEHVLSFGYLDASLDAQFESLFADVAQKLSGLYDRPVIAFEHGAESFRNRGGSCTDHAHTHVFPADPRLDLVTALRADFDLRPAPRFLPAARDQVALRQRPYLWLRGADGDMWVCDAPKALSQYVRRMIVAQLGRTGEWDWLVFPGTAHMRATVERLHRSCWQ